jgi:UDP-N-acetylglucosamine transferase subunit ALG13
MAASLHFKDYLQRKRTSMIFVTIGTQGPFDRLIRAVDRAAELFSDPVIAQVSSGGSYKPKNLITSDLMPFTEFQQNFSKARLIVAHAGMGTIINALVENKPILILPRLAKYREQRNDHQWATAKAFEKLKYVHTAYDEDELYEKLKTFATSKAESLYQIGNFASEDLIKSLRGDLMRSSTLQTSSKYIIKSA